MKRPLAVVLVLVVVLVAVPLALAGSGGGGGGHAYGKSKFQLNGRIVSVDRRHRHARRAGQVAARGPSRRSAVSS